MPDLGQYRAEVLLAYGGALALLILLILLSVWQARRVRRKLDEIEARRQRSA